MNDPARWANPLGVWNCFCFQVGKGRFGGYD